jgi:16S rRNA (uracil1498-N3)-methyltransferase
MRRFAITPERIDGERVSFDRAQTRHLARVLRLRPGDLVIATDGCGHEYTIRIEELGPSAAGTIVAVAASAAESPLSVTLVQGIPKSDKMEAIVRAATELGVSRILPAITARTVVSLEEGPWRDRGTRWQRVATEAAKQSGRAVVPEIAAPAILPEALARGASGALRLCLWEREARVLGEVLVGVNFRPPSASVMIGPEGGLEPGEVEQARAQGWTVAGLGARILRTETAGPAVLAILQERFGDIGMSHR